MATRKSAESTLYHLSPRGFWKTFRAVVAVNPEISYGLPNPEMNRYPPPSSRPEKYATPVTKASDIASNPYWVRDVRRMYPQLSVVTQPELSTLLLEHSNSVVQSAPSTDGKAPGNAGVATSSPKTLDLSEAIVAITTVAKVYSELKLPPSFPIPHHRWVPRLTVNAPHDPDSYFPMALYK